MSRTVNARFGQWLSILVCLLIGLKIESSVVDITRLTSAVAKGAGNFELNYLNFIGPV